jgi:hypothetical protein
MKKKINLIITNFNKNSIIRGLKKGLIMETLPYNIRNFLELPIIRILRVIGGLCVLFSLLIINKYIIINLPIFILHLINIIAIFQLIQIVVISIIKIIYGLNKLITQPKEFEIKD